MKQNTKAIIFTVCVISIINVLAYLAWKNIDDSIYTPNCWEERIEGINLQTGNKAFYSDNFRCKYFQQI